MMATSTPAGGVSLEELLVKAEGWKLASIIVRRDRGWCYGGKLTYDVLLEAEDDYEIRGTGPTPVAALQAAVEKCNGQDAEKVGEE